MAEYFISCSQKIYKLKNAGAQMLPYIYQGHQIFLKIHFLSENVYSFFKFTQRYNGRRYIMLLNL